MSDDKRNGSEPIPDHHYTYLTQEQKTQLKKIEGFGWQLKFIRRPLFKPVTVVVMNSDSDSIGVLEEDGRLNLEPDVNIRP
jgi:hypothetical protein